MGFPPSCFGLKGPSQLGGHYSISLGPNRYSQCQFLMCVDLSAAYNAGSAHSLLLALPQLAGLLLLEVSELGLHPHSYLRFPISAHSFTCRDSWIPWNDWPQMMSCGTEELPGWQAWISDPQNCKLQKKKKRGCFQPWNFRVISLGAIDNWNNYHLSADDSQIERTSSLNSRFISDCMFDISTGTSYFEFYQNGPETRIQLEVAYLRGKLRKHQ